MRSRASIYKHPIHPMLIVFPIALWIFSFICDVVFLSGSANAVLWRDMAFYTMAGGVIGALLAAIPGFLDYLGLLDHDVKKIATTHMLLNLTIVGLYLFNLGLRMNAPEQGRVTAVVISAVALILLAISGWLGGSLVYVHGIAVESHRGEEPFTRRDRVA
jgi:uncharacterized membrane protein